MPGAHFNRERWPVDGPHLNLLEVLRDVHTGNGLRSLRVIGRDMNLAYTQVHKIVRGVALPVDEQQVRDLVHAVAGRHDDETTTQADTAVGHWRAAVAAKPDPARPIIPDPPTPPDPPPTSSHDPRPKRVLPPRRVLLVATAVVVAAGATTVIGAWQPTTSTRDAVAEQVVLVDDFGTGEIDPVHWNRPERPDVVSVRDGALHFSVDADDTADGLHTEFAPRATNPFTEVSFVARVPGYDRSGPGGIALIVTESGGRNHRLVFGPSSGGPEAAALFCETEFCGQFDDYRPPSTYIPFEVGESVPIRLVAAGGRLNFYVRDRLVEQSAPIGMPLSSLVFDVYGADSEAWTITVDSVMVINQA